ncbi:siderophore-interacting protein [Kribbella sp. NPDC004536]|uniref:siderophore-interacting protein n=1 Tax=Kribbella sp. NPDC004536 TaxID=3364106 RepID=UPI00367E54CB
MRGSTIRAEIGRLTRSGDSRLTCPVRVEGIESLTPGFTRVTVQGDGLAAYRTIRPADAFKLMIPPDGFGSVRMPKVGPSGAPVWPEDRPTPLTREFTVRTFDPGTRRLAFDVVLHGDSPAITWLGNTRPGDTLVLLGMRREFHAGDVDHHLLIGDSTSLPAIASIVESLDVPSTVYLQAESPAERSLVKGDVQWIHAQPLTALEQTVRTFVRPPGRLQAWCAAEAGVVRSIRSYLVDDLGVHRDDLHTAPYWTADPAVVQAPEFS